MLEINGWEILGLVIYSLFILWIGYIIGKSVGINDAEDNKMANEINKALVKDLLSKAHFIPKTELLKEMMIQMHNEGCSNGEISRSLGLHITTVGKAFRKRGITK